MQKKPNALPTTERLARALEAVGSPLLEGMIDLARSGYYDDFKSSLIQPQVTLYGDLKSLGFDDLAQRVVDGEFDCTKEEAEEWMRLAECLTSSVLKRFLPR
jgi:hypothetical protein